VDFTENQQVIRDVLINPAEKKTDDLLLNKNDTSIIIKIIPYEQRRKELEVVKTDFDLSTNTTTFKLEALFEVLFKDKKRPSEEEFVDKLKELARSVAEYSLWKREKRIRARQSTF
jgi:hypothetical protein